MGHYELDDPALQARMDEMAAAEAAAWPAPNEEQLAVIARLLKPVRTAARPVPSYTPATSTARRAA